MLDRMQNFTINAQIFALGSSVVLNLYRTNLTGGLISSSNNKKGFEQPKDRITNQLAKQAFHLQEQSHPGEPSSSTYISCTQEKEIEEKHPLEQR